MTILFPPKWKIAPKSEPRFSLVEERLTTMSEIRTKRSKVNRNDNCEEAFRFVAIVQLQSLPEELNESRRLKVKTATLPSCEEGIYSRILKKPEGTGVTLLNSYFRNF